jgi:signal peptidase I
MNPDPVPAPPALWRRLVFGRRPKRTLLRAAMMALTALVVFRYVLVPVRIQGVSMLPAYRDGRINFINQLAYRWTSPRRGDVVGVRLAGRHVMLLKRIVGLPGETLAIERGQVLINQRPLAEPYVRQRAPWQLSARRLGPEEFFVMGDNRDMDQQAHVFGATRAERIVGKILW